MRKVISVRGVLDGEKLGFCQCHEHLMLAKGEGWQQNHALCMDDVEKSLEEVKRYRQAGGGALIDAQPVGCCRMERELVEVSGGSGIAILASTGFHRRVFYPRDHWVFRESAGFLQRIFEEELTEGMYADCDRQFSGKQIAVRAGVVKVALEGADCLAQGRGRYTAAIMAAIHCERSLLVHTEKESPVLEFLKLAAGMGLEMNRIAICHMDRTQPELTVHLEAAKRGAFLEYDTIGRFQYHDDEREEWLISQIRKAGLEGRLLLSLDTTAARMKAYDPKGIGLDYLLKKFLPYMAGREGIGVEQIKELLTTNSRAYLTA